MRRKLLAAGVAAALLYNLSLPGHPAPWLGWLALLPLLGALEAWRPDGRRAGRWLALPFGLVFGLGSSYWLPAISPAADVTVPGILWLGWLAWACYLCLAPWLFVRILIALRPRLGAATFLAAPFVWTGLEWLRGSGVLAFSWLHLSQTQAAPGGYLAPAGWVGGLGLGFLMLLAQSSLAAAVWGMRETRGLAARACGATLLLLALMSLPSHRVGERSLPVAALQGNVALKDKWAPHFRMENLHVFRELSEEAALAGARLIVWPETAFPVNILYDRHAEQALRRTARDLGVPILTGFQALAPAQGGGYIYRNAASLLTPNGALEGIYSKARLLPFGEYIPMAELFAPGVEIDLGQSDFTPGKGVRVFEGAELPLAPFICSEMGFARAAGEAGGRGARLLVNITNDGWFAHPLALELHAALSPMRAAENGVPVLRCGNSGVTEILDARGRLVGRLPTNVKAALLGEIAVTERPSFYARFGGWLQPLLYLLYGAALLAVPRLLSRGTASVLSSPASDSQRRS